MKSVIILLICLFILVVFSDFLLSVSSGFHPSDGTSFAAAGAGDGNGDPTPLPPNPPPPPPPTPPPPPPVYNVMA